MNRTADRLAAVMIVAGSVVGVALFGRIPLYRFLVASLLPITASVTYVILRALRRRSAAAHRRGPLVAIALYAVAFIMGLHVLMVCNLAGVGWARALGPRAVVVLLGGAFAAAGNLLPRTPPNLAFGIRTRLTLEDPHVWSATHRICGYAAVGLGCAIGLAGMFLQGPAIGRVVAVSAIGAVASLTVAYKSLEDEKH